ncbi:MAG: Asp-tRNA(Asn)/Glu-tRNA(Gln) amidotransferase subunit GatC [Anaerolineales bacterium]
MSLTLEEVEHIAALARLELTTEEKARFREQLTAILDYADRLQELNTSAIPPTATVLPLHSVTRADEVRPSLSRDLLLRNAPETEAGSFRVPPVLDKQA